MASPVLDEVATTPTALEARETPYAMQINYYSDTGCTQWLNSVKIDYSKLSTTVNYHIDRSKSVNIANCWVNGECEAQFCGDPWGCSWASTRSGYTNCVDFKGGYSGYFMPRAIFYGKE